MEICRHRARGEREWTIAQLLLMLIAIAHALRDRSLAPTLHKLHISHSQSRRAQEVDGWSWCSGAIFIWATFATGAHDATKRWFMITLPRRMPPAQGTTEDPFCLLRLRSVTPSGRSPIDPSTHRDSSPASLPSTDAYENSIITATGSGARAALPMLGPFTPSLGVVPTLRFLFADREYLLKLDVRPRIAPGARETKKKGGVSWGLFSTSFGNEMLETSGESRKPIYIYFGSFLGSGRGAQPRPAPSDANNHAQSAKKEVTLKVFPFRQRQFHLFVGGVCEHHGAP